MLFKSGVSILGLRPLLNSVSSEPLQSPNCSQALLFPRSFQPLYSPPLSGIYSQLSLAATANIHMCVTCVFPSLSPSKRYLSHRRRHIFLRRSKHMFSNSHGRLADEFSRSLRSTESTNLTVTLQHMLVLQICSSLHFFLFFLFLCIS